MGAAASLEAGSAAEGLVKAALAQVKLEAVAPPEERAAIVVEAVREEALAAVSVVAEAAVETDSALRTWHSRLRCNYLASEAACTWQS